MESAVLATIGGSLGVLIAGLGRRRAREALPEAGLLDGGIPAETSIHISSPVLLFAVAVTFGATFLFGLGRPGGHRRRMPPSPCALGDRAGSGHQPLRAALIVAEVALAVVLLAGAGLLLRSFAQLVRTDPGFRTERVLSMRLNLPPARYDKPGATARFAEQLTGDVRKLPGVQSVAAVSHPPFRMPTGGLSRWKGARRQSSDERG